MMDGQIFGVNGTRLYCEVEGPEDAPVVVLLHGFSLDRRMWDGQVRPFTEHYQVVRYDLRGFGRSAVPEPGVHYEHQNDLSALLDRLGIDQVALVGLSLGGAVALDFTLSHPERVRRLVLASSMVPGFDMPDLAEISRPVWRAARSEGVAAARRLWLASPLFEPAHQQPLIRNALTQMIGDYSGWGWTERDPARWHEPDIASRLAEITCPTQVIVGEQDIAGMRRAADVLASEIRIVDKVELAGLGHLPNLEDAAAFNAAVLPFLDAVV